MQIKNVTPPTVEEDPFQTFSGIQNVSSPVIHKFVRDLIRGMGPLSSETMTIMVFVRGKVPEKSPDDVQSMAVAIISHPDTVIPMMTIQTPMSENFGLNIFEGITMTVTGGATSNTFRKTMGIINSVMSDEESLITLEEVTNMVVLNSNDCMPQGMSARVTFVAGTYMFDPHEGHPSEGAAAMSI